MNLHIFAVYLFSLHIKVFASNPQNAGEVPPPKMRPLTKVTIFGILALGIAEF